jgi:exoribonuclease R
VVPVDGGFTLALRPRLESEEHNAALSLATNLAVADLLAMHRTGLFRVMAEPDDGAVRRLRHSAEAFGIAWPQRVELAAFEKGLDARDPAQAALMLAIRRSGGGASYTPWRDGERPWHSAMAAAYAHATAPLRRLGDRYVVLAALALANGREIPESAAVAFERLPPVMARAEALGGQIDRAAVDLAETVMLKDRIGEIFPAVVTDADERGARLQFRDLAVVARVAADHVRPGAEIRVRLAAADPEQRKLSFERIG